MADDDVPTEPPSMADDDLASLVTSEAVEEVVAKERTPKRSTTPKPQTTRQPTAAKPKPPEPAPPTQTGDEAAALVHEPTATPDYVTPVLHIRVSPRTVDLGIKAAVGTAAVVGAVVFPVAGAAATGLYVARWRHEHRAKEASMRPITKLEETVGGGE